MSEFHVNANDGVVHVHGCPEHPDGGLGGLVVTYEARDGKVQEKRHQSGSCFFFEEHVEAFCREHADEALTAVAAARVTSEKPEHVANCVATLKRLEAIVR